MDESLNRLPRPHPLAGPAIAFILGIWAGLCVPLPRYWCLGLFVAVAMWLVLSLAQLYAPRGAARYAMPSIIALLVAGVFSGGVCASTTARRNAESIETLREVKDSEAETVLRGKVVTEPTVTPLKNGGARLRFNLKVDEIAYECDPVKLGGSIVRVDWYGPRTMANIRPPFPVPKAGEGWQLCGVLDEEKSHGAVPRPVLRRRLSDSFSKRYPKLDCGITERSIWNARAFASKALSKGVESRTNDVALIRAMVLGYRSDIPPSVESAFRDSGTIHVFAISGLHVGMVATTLLFMLIALGMPVRVRYVFAACLLVVYAVLTGGRPSAIRATFMAVVFFASILFNRQSDGITALGLAAVGILVCSPMEITELGFIFSFVCTLGIFTLLPVVNSLLDVLLKWLREHLWQRAIHPEQKTQRSRNILPQHFRESAWGLPAFLLDSVRSLPQSCARFLKSLLCVSLVAWLSSAPLTAICFGQIAPISVFSNLLVIPLATLLVASAVVSLMTCFWFPPVSILMNKIAVTCAHYLVGAARFGADVFGVSVQISETSAVKLAILWYFMLILTAELFVACGITTAKKR